MQPTAPTGALCAGRCQQDRQPHTPQHCPATPVCTNASRFWPFAELTQDQRLANARFEARARNGQLRDLPTVFGELA